MASIEGVDVAVFVVPTPAPESDGTLTWDATTVVVAEPYAGGERGLGFTYATGACGALIQEVLADVVTGRDAMDVPGAWEAMVRSIRNLGRPGIASMAIAALDIALWDLKGRLLDLPVCRLLGQVHTEVPVYGSGGFTSYGLDELARQLSGWVEHQGVSKVKIKVGESWGQRPARDLTRARLARKVIGDDVELFVDANGGYATKQAIRMGHAYSDIGVTWFEEPVSSDHLASLAEIRAQCTLDVTAGEYGYDVHYFQAMCEAGAVDCLQADVSRCAGITEWMRVATVAESHGLEISAHCAPSLHVHPACAVPNLAHLEYFADHVRVDPMLFDGVLEPQGGMVRPDANRPGLGLELKRREAEAYRVR